MPTIPQPAQLTARQRRTILSVLSLVLFAAIVDISALNVALPSMGRDLKASIGELQWFVDIYMLVLAAILLFAGSMGDRFGRKRALVLGLTFFGVGSLLAMLAWSPAIMITARAIQGIGGSTMPPIALAIISNVFLDEKERARAIGTWGAIMGVALASGPLVGGALTHFVSWRAVFGVNIPIVIATIVMIVRIVPETRAAHARAFDPAGQLLAVVVLVCTTISIIRIGETGLGRLEIMLLVVAALALAAFIIVERHIREPLLELRFFRSWPFALANIIAFLAFGAYAGFQFVTALYLQNSLMLSAFTAGLFLVPMALGNSVLALVSSRMVTRYGPRVPVILFSAILAVAAAVLLTTTAETAWPQYFAASILFGGGMGAANAALTNTALSGMPRAQSGVAGATLSAARQTGQSLGVAVLGALLNSGQSLGRTAPLAAHPGWWVVLALAIVAGILGWLAGTPAARQSEHAVASLITD